MLAILLLLTACATPATETPVVDPSAAASIAGGANCAPIDLRLPSGERLDLTGAWRGSELVHHVRQIGDCVWWIAYSDKPGQALGALYTITFLGHVNTDFSIAGDWAGIVRLDNPSAHYASPHTEGAAEFEVVIDGETGEVTIERQGGAAFLTGASTSYPANILRFIGPLPEPLLP